jgi:PAS domain S-box-containing protein
MVFLKSFSAKDFWRMLGKNLTTRCADITGSIVKKNTRELEAAQKALEASEETFRVALEYAAIGMALVSPDGKWLRVNTALCELLGYEAEEFTDMNFQSLTHPDDLEADLQHMKQILAGEVQSYEMEKRYFHKDGSIVWTMLNVSLARYPDGSPRYFIKQIQDITERKQIEKMKSEFISTVSHELRTPLTSIRGALGLLSAGSAGHLPSAAQELINIAHNNSGRLVKIINDILDIEKIESGKLQIHLKPVDSLYILRQALEASRIYAEKCQVKFELGSVPVGAEVMADPDRLMQVMANLLSNAAKFSPAHATVQVSAAIHESFIRFSVADHGAGIPDAFRATIFEKFVQADNSDSRNFEGTGLGLSITKKLVEAMHGSIGFETELGKGSTFYFDLPIAQHQHVSPLTSHVIGNSRILVCEDDPDIARLLDMMLEQYGFDVDIALTLKDAEAKLQQNHYSAITLDMKMPDGEGFNFALGIKNNPALRHIPVIALSGKSEEIRGRMKESAHAVEEWLAKPIDNNELLLALQRVITEKFSSLPFILHVEDDRDLTQVIAESLRHQAYVVGAGNLREAHTYLKQRKFDLLIVDPILPDGSGLSLLEHVKTIAGYDLPILILSADEVDADIRNKVRAALVKSLMSEARITETILSFISTHPSHKAFT